MNKDAIQKSYGTKFVSAMSVNKQEFEDMIHRLTHGEAMLNDYLNMVTALTICRVIITEDK